MTEKTTRHREAIPVVEARVRTFARIIARGGRRSDCVRIAMERWQVSERQALYYISAARDELRKDWEIERPQMVADLLSQCSTLQMEARQAGQFHIALGAINTAAKLAQLFA